MDDLNKANTGELSYHDAAQLLGSLGIDCITPEKIAELEFYNAETEMELGLKISRVINILTKIGTGEYDYINSVFVPASKTVYAFDTRFFNYEKMYSDFLIGINSISAGDYQITDIAEEVIEAVRSAEEEENFKRLLMNMDDDAGTEELMKMMGDERQTHHISFKLNSKQCVFDVNTYNDWFSDDMLHMIQEKIIEENTGKRLHIMSDGQYMIVFYNTDQWAEDFRDKTGFVLMSDF